MTSLPYLCAVGPLYLNSDITTYCSKINARSNSISYSFTCHYWEKAQQENDDLMLPPTNMGTFIFELLLKSIKLSYLSNHYRIDHSTPLIISSCHKERKKKYKELRYGVSASEKREFNWTASLRSLRSIGLSRTWSTDCRK